MNTEFVFGEEELDEDMWINIRYLRDSEKLEIGGGYETYCVAEPQFIGLREFFDRLEITKEDCDAAWSEK